MDRVLIAALRLKPGAVWRKGHLTEPVIKYRFSSQLEPLKWTELAGWSRDDHFAAFAAYQASCHALRKGLNVCRKASDLPPKDSQTARTFFEENFQPVRIARLGERAGLLTGYFEPIVQDSHFPNPEFRIPLYRRPRNLVAAGSKPGSSRISK